MVGHSSWKNAFPKQVFRGRARGESQACSNSHIKSWMIIHHERTLSQTKCTEAYILCAWQSMGGAKLRRQTGSHTLASPNNRKWIEVDHQRSSCVMGFTYARSFDKEKWSLLLEVRSDYQYHCHTSIISLVLTEIHSITNKLPHIWPALHWWITHHWISSPHTWGEFKALIQTHSIIESTEWLLASQVNCIVYGQHYIDESLITKYIVILVSIEYWYRLAQSRNQLPVSNILLDQ
jgi:hypothetical protein